MLQWLYTYVANVCFHYFIYLFRRMLQEYLSRCWICFTPMLQVFYLDVAYVLQWFGVSCVFWSVSDAYFKYFICLQTYVANVSSGCFKSIECCTWRRLLASSVLLQGFRSLASSHEHQDAGVRPGASNVLIALDHPRTLAKFDKSW
jgi:hypothetical protein